MIVNRHALNLKGHLQSDMLLQNRLVPNNMDSLVLSWTQKGFQLMYYGNRPYFQVCIDKAILQHKVKVPPRSSCTLEKVLAMSGIKYMLAHKLTSYYTLVPGHCECQPYINQATTHHDHIDSLLAVWWAVGDWLHRMVASDYNAWCLAGSCRKPCSVRQGRQGLGQCLYYWKMLAPAYQLVSGLPHQYRPQWAEESPGGGLSLVLTVDQIDFYRMDLLEAM